ncbi:MAG TPA: DUF1634 domain-containing protein [Bryobacteraceae bacterium]|jgi:uncharacterized membrane protein|nr:DUF1634 domain-containing protein [Bryobacteraceae bacterium]
MRVSDHSIERSVSVLLISGVIVAGSVTLGGGILFLILHWSDSVNYSTFHSQPRIDRIVPQIVRGALRGRARSIIQLGILLLIATPVARVAFSLAGFALERDKMFVLITAIVLAILVYSLVNGALTN